MENFTFCVNNCLTFRKTWIIIRLSSSICKILEGRLRKLSNLKKARLTAGLNINDAAKVIGISPSFLHQIEAGERAVESDKAELIAKTYKVDINEIFVIKRYKSK